MNVTETELFNAAEYEVPFPTADGKQVDEIVLRIAGTLKMNRNDPEHAAFIESLSLGEMHVLNVTVSVDGKTQTVRRNVLDEEVVNHTVMLRVHEASK